MIPKGLTRDLALSTTTQHDQLVVAAIQRKIRRKYIKVRAWVLLRSAAGWLGRGGVAFQGARIGVTYFVHPISEVVTEGQICAISLARASHHWLRDLNSELQRASLSSYFKGDCTPASPPEERCLGQTGGGRSTLSALLET